VTLAATNATGTSSNATLTLNIAATAPTAIPTINSAASASGTVGSQFGYQISASNSPTSYSVAAGTTLPSGLSLNATTGPSSPFTLTFTITAAPPAGNGPAPNELVYKVAQLYGAQCAAVAMGSSSK
jgi:hypothetical protein